MTHVVVPSTTCVISQMSLSFLYEMRSIKDKLTLYVVFDRN